MCLVAVRALSPVTTTWTTALAHYKPEKERDKKQNNDEGRQREDLEEERRERWRRRGSPFQGAMPGLVAIHHPATTIATTTSTEFLSRRGRGGRAELRVSLSSAFWWRHHPRRKIVVLFERDQPLPSFPFPKSRSVQKRPGKESFHSKETEEGRKKNPFPSAFNGVTFITPFSSSLFPPPLFVKARSFRDPPNDLVRMIRPYDDDSGSVVLWSVSRETFLL